MKSYTKTIIIIAIIVVVTILAFLGNREDRKREQIDKQADELLDQLKADRLNKATTSPPPTPSVQNKKPSTPKPSTSPTPTSTQFSATVRTTPITPVVSELKIDVSYSQVMNGLTDYFVMNPNRWPDGTTGYISATNGTMPHLLIEDNGDKGNITMTSLTIFSDSAKQLLYTKILSQYVQNIFPDWPEGNNWVITAMNSCGSDGKPHMTIKGEKQLGVNCNSNLGIYSVEIKHGPQTSTQVDQKIDYSSFQEIHVVDYVKNPPAYLNKNVKVLSAFVADFLAEGDRGGDTSFIVALDGRDPLNLSYLMLEIVDTNNYQKVVSAVNKGDLIVVYGVGILSHPFKSSIGEGLRPIVKVLRLDICGPTSSAYCSSGTTNTIFSSNQ